MTITAEEIKLRIEFSCLTIWPFLERTETYSASSEQGPESRSNCVCKLSFALFSKILCSWPAVHSLDVQ